jgi:hypothetical protein
LWKRLQGAAIFPEVSPLPVEYKDQMACALPSDLKVDRKAFSVGSISKPSDKKAYWLARTPSER